MYRPHNELVWVALDTVSWRSNESDKMYYSHILLQRDLECITARFLHMNDFTILIYNICFPVFRRFKVLFTGQRSLS